MTTTTTQANEQEIFQYALFKNKDNTKKQEAVLSTSPKKALLKTLFASDIILDSISTIEGTKVYKFFSDIFAMPFYIVENLVSSELKLLQDKYLIDANLFNVQLILNKLK